MTLWKIPPLIGLPETQRPVVGLDGTMTFWHLLALVNQRLKQHGHFASAEEFRALAVSECDGDVGMLIMLALSYVTVPGAQEVPDNET